MKKLLLSTMLIAGLVMAAPAIVQAGHKGGSGYGSECTKCAAKEEKCKISKLKKKVKMLWVHKDALNINKVQLDKIKAIKHTAIKELIQLEADKEIMMVDLNSELWKETMDLGATNKLIDKKYSTKKQSAKVFVKAISDIQQVLTPEQRAQWHSMCVAQKLGKCSDCAASGSKCKKCASSDSKCKKCAASGEGKFCPLTGKPLGAKGSTK